MIKNLLALTLPIALLSSCSPGDAPDNSKPAGGSDAGPPATPGAPTCKLYTTALQVEEKLLIPKCGKNSDCHSGMTWKPTIKDLGKTVEAVLDQRGMFCTSDKFVNKAEPQKSIILVRVNATGSMVKCPSSTLSGNKMPPNDGDFYREMPLMKEEIDCINWWVYQIIR